MSYGKPAPQVTKDMTKCNEMELVELHRQSIGEIDGSRRLGVVALHACSHALRIGDFAIDLTTGGEQPFARTDQFAIERATFW
ncbi:hypothetical protein B4Q13_24605 [Lacticaseibacillus rhamnosus]